MIRGPLWLSIIQTFNLLSTMLDIIYITFNYDCSSLCAYISPVTLPNFDTLTSLQAYARLLWCTSNTFVCSSICQTSLIDVERVAHNRHHKALSIPMHIKTTSDQVYKVIRHISALWSRVCEHARVFLPCHAGGVLEVHCVYRADNRSEVDSTKRFKAILVEYIPVRFLGTFNSNREEE